MRDYLLFYVNGKEQRVSGADALMPLSSYLRYCLGMTGTKVVCEEGDCGACTVLLGRAQQGSIEYKALNSCIKYLYQLDLSHVVSVEGLKYSGDLNPVQNAMVSCHGSQCGFCTPGFVVSLCGYLDRSKDTEAKKIKDCVTGNLCRCTGYEAIIKAAMNVELEKLLPLSELYPPDEIIKAFASAESVSVKIETAEQSVFIPASLEEACKFKSENPQSTIIAGGSDVCVNINKRSFAPPVLMSLSHLHELEGISCKDGMIKVGAKTLLSEVEDYFTKKVPDFQKLLWLFGSPQIRNAGTLAGNIANASPIADTPPFLMVMDAVLELKSADGTRQVRINDFFKDYKKTAIAPDELITAILIPLPGEEDIIKLYKVSRRAHLDISTISAAFRLRLKGETVEDIAIAYGGVAPTIIRLPKTELFLKNKKLTLGTVKESAEILCSEISPISDVRGSKPFRYKLAANLLLKLYYDLTEGRITLCRP